MTAPTNGGGGGGEFIDATWKAACVGREGYCSPDLQDAARVAIGTALKRGYNDGWLQAHRRLNYGYNPRDLEQDWEANSTTPPAQVGAATDSGEGVACLRCRGCGMLDAGGAPCMVCQGTGIDPGEDDPVAELLAMIDAAEPQDGTTVWDHTPEEIGLHVMENYAVIRAALAASKEAGQ